MVKKQERKQAIKLRKKGLSYSEILDKVSVSKSSLSRWFKEVKLAEPQKQRITEKKIEARKRGWEARRRERIKRTKTIKKKARKEIGKINKRDLWMIGTALYWAEGDKQKKHSISTRVALGNSDPYVIKIFLKWLLEICKVDENALCFRICLHETARAKLEIVQKHWAEISGFPVERFRRITWKKHNIKTKRHNKGKNYFGLLIVKVRKSTDLNRKIAGWIEGICKNL